MTVSAKSASQGGKLFGSVTPADIVGAVRAQGGPNLDKRLVDIPQHIKSTGGHKVVVRLHPDVAVELPLDVQAV